MTVGTRSVAHLDDWMTDHEHPGAAACGDPHRGLDAIWRRERRWVAALLLAHMPSGVDLEDLLQEVALALVRHAGTLRDPAKLRPWLRTIALNVARGAGRKERVRRRVHVPLADGAADSAADPAQERAREREAARAAATRAIRLVERLPPEYREPLLLRCVRGLSQRRIAELMSVTETTVETRLARARRRLREALSRDPEGAGTQE